MKQRMQKEKKTKNKMKELRRTRDQRQIKVDTMRKTSQDQRVMRMEKELMLRQQIRNRLSQSSTLTCLTQRMTTSREYQAQNTKKSKGLKMKS